jgi:hypothetical protein
VDNRTIIFQMGKVRAALCIIEEVGVVVKYSGLDDVKYALNRVWNFLYESSTTEKKAESQVKSSNKRSAAPKTTPKSAKRRLRTA